MRYFSAKNKHAETRAKQKQKFAALSKDLDSRTEDDLGYVDKITQLQNNKKSMGEKVLVLTSQMDERDSQIFKLEKTLSKLRKSRLSSHLESKENTQELETANETMEKEIEDLQAELKSYESLAPSSFRPPFFVSLRSG